MPKKKIALVDLGTGIKGRAYLLAKKHPKKRFVGVDIKKIKSDLANIEYKQAGALEYLKKAKPHSIRVLNIDFAAMSEKLFTDYGVKEGIVINQKFLTACKKALARNGRLYFSVGGWDLQGILEELKKAGFETSFQDFNRLIANGKISTLSPSFHEGTSKMIQQFGVLPNFFRVCAISRQR